jgi:putative tryptophan/tyrosine transport system substrate-binding protein
MSEPMAMRSKTHEYRKAKNGMNRRHVIAVLGVLNALSGVASAEPPKRLRRLGVLNTIGEHDPVWQSMHSAFLQDLKQLGWTEGSNLEINYRHGAGENLDRIRTHAAELVALKPDVLVTGTTIGVKALQQASHSTPIVFYWIVNPVERGVVDSLAHPGGRTTGFTGWEPAIGGRWMQMLKEVAPAVARIGAVHHPSNPLWGEAKQTVERAGFQLGIDVSSIDVTDATEIEHGLESFARGSAGGLIVLPEPITASHIDLIVTLASRFALPAIYGAKVAPFHGGLMSYGVDYIDVGRRAASYVDRILRGDDPANLPVQQPTKFELVINLKTAKTLGLNVPSTLLAHADEVIE